MKKKILLLKIENESVYNPLGLLYIGSYLKDNGYDVKLEIISSKLFEDRSFADEKAKEILKEDYLFIGFSVLTGPQTKFSAILSRKIKELNEGMLIIWGGCHPSLIQEGTLRESYVDIIAIGEGEKTALELADALSQGKPLELIDGIGYKKDGKLIFNKERDFIKDLDEIRVDWSLVDMQKCLIEFPGRNTKGFIYITSRGCPHDCSFCYNKVFNKRRWRAHSIKRVISDIQRIKETCRIEAIAFTDDHFFVDRNRSFEILSRLKEIGITCAEFQLRVDEITEDSMKKINELGVRKVYAGVESGNDRVLSLMNKNTNKKMILEKFKILSKYRNIAVGSSFILGYPTETLAEIKDTINLGLELARIIPDIVVTHQTFLPFPGTDGYKLAIKEGFKLPQKTEDYEIYDAFGRSIPITWLPWADKNTSELFYRIDKYGKLLTHSKSTSLLRTFGKKFFYNLAKFRLKNRFFAFPFEIFILLRFNRYYNPDCKIK
ncbi:MAG: radical SAM protein [Candidatus Omnitrophota bacterium]|nr:radical SAM protein [Candidatus Omnitrophota bacterium]